MYRIPYQILSSDTDANRTLRLSRLFTLLQEASIAHTTLLGMGRERTLDRGLLWIVTLQRAQILRLPVYDERIVLKSWPGKTMHLLFPRYYRIEDEQGHALVAASALWARSVLQTARHPVVSMSIRCTMPGLNTPLMPESRSPQWYMTALTSVPV